MLCMVVLSDSSLTCEGFVVQQVAGPAFLPTSEQVISDSMTSQLRLHFSNVWRLLTSR